MNKNDILYLDTKMYTWIGNLRIDIKGFIDYDRAVLYVITDENGKQYPRINRLYKTQLCRYCIKMRWKNHHFTIQLDECVRV